MQGKRKVLMTGAAGYVAAVEELAAQFAASHPGAERFLRELVDSLGKLGI